MIASRTRSCKAALAIMASLFVTSVTHAQIIDPEAYIKKAGAESSRIGDDGRTQFYNYTERAKADRIGALERSIEGLPKRVEIFQVCDQMRGSVKAKLVKDSGRTIDVAAVNYGHSGSTIACALKYMHKNEVGTQLVFMKQGKDGMYMLFVTD